MKKFLDGRVAIVTGAGSGLGKAHALALARHGARVVVNDVAGRHEGSPGRAVADEIVRAGGLAIADGGDVTDFAQMEQMAARAIGEWGRIDILVNNAGVLRDKTFSKMSLDDFRRVMDVHLMGTVHCVKAVWEHMRERRYGRIVMTTSSSGLYGNFGQSNYSAAKMALVGLMQTLALEGAKQNIRVNCLAPTAATAMTEGVLPPEALARLAPDNVSPGLVALVGEDAPTRTILLAGAGSFESANITMTQGIFIGDAEDPVAHIRSRMDEILDRQDERVPGTGFEQYQLELSKAGIEMALPGA
ncbi:NAD(P)-dependent dehydrogenase (short-subunit alcohol dehydrogenase family) [Variovorax boronicumulans]|jgi:NAD(P)-dependent dehydrogenase (short-subunit alcohol dehydrogenase family)|uniref:Short-chain dehydrogenase/reductase SDR n=1 Tax=Variovorax paradoxus (strain EPS) TaxID=595537 RepID=E6V8D4_VARPE|nr:MULTISPECIES: SDR family NAD(P)-dependent oxidoreductase [Variovorax]ADU39558.1 short-chain dehydrogenase/reductase SDR [Variovorax paradoxus EPS]MDP9993584.1 NAD(P)-dependent dehydrogenase (short-subunit alcohol dehydrogenase family) [Variovorax boronicumulans]MDQ0004885.1 NAD(P)-dependent dehydrogenase (short-subunit alcohol dehydrogenase family) [Variovorax boronicumulans]